MSFTINWGDIPVSPRTKVINYTILDSPHSAEIAEYLIRLDKELAKFNAIYDQNDTAIFESEAHYNWFLLRWS